MLLYYLNSRCQNYSNYSNSTKSRNKQKYVSKLKIQLMLKPILTIIRNWSKINWFSDLSNRRSVKFLRDSIMENVPKILSLAKSFVTFFKLIVDALPAGRPV